MTVASNAGAINYRHLWKVSFAGAQQLQLTQGNSIEMYPVMVSGGKQIAFMQATAKSPFLPYIAAADEKGAKPLATQALPANFPSSQLVEPEQVTFKAADGMEIHGQLFKPKNISGRAPGVVFMHGGPIRQMLPT